MHVQVNGVGFVTGVVGTQGPSVVVVVALEFVTVQPVMQGNWVIKPTLQKGELSKYPSTI